MEKVVILYPPTVIKGRYNQVSTGHEVAPQPLLYLGAVLRANGYQCELLDANALGLSLEETADRIVALKPTVVGISSPTMLISTSAQICSLIKTKDSDIMTIVGGPHITVVPQETMFKFKDIDIGVLGEGEETLLDLLANKHSLGNVKGIAYRMKEKIIQTEPRPYLKDLDSLPLPAWDMLGSFPKLYQQSSARIDRLPNVSLITSRGCPFKCAFCARNVFGNVVRAHSVGYVLAMLKHLKKHYKIRSVSFEDENFTAIKPRLREFCLKMIDEKLNITWDCASHINSVDEDMLKLMKKAGCWQINYGLESGSQRILDFINKGLILDRTKNVLSLTRKAKIQTKGYFIIGLPGESLETIQETIDFAKQSDLDIFQMSFMSPFPGTQLYDAAGQYGEFNKDWDNTNIWTPLFIPFGLTREVLENESKRAYREFYFRPKPILGFVRRSLRFSVFMKYASDGFKMLKFLISKN